MPTIYAAVLANLQERDARDRLRAVAPLVPASDAFVIDTTEQDIDAAFEVAARLRRRARAWLMRCAGRPSIDGRLTPSRPEPSPDATATPRGGLDAPTRNEFMTQPQMTTEPTPRRGLRRAARRDAPPERADRRLGDHRHRRRDRQRRGRGRRRPEVRGPRSAQGVRHAGAAGRGPGRRSGRGLRRALREQGGEASSAATRRAARRAGTSSSRRSTTTPRSRA